MVGHTTGSAGLAVANQLYNSLQHEGKQLGKGDIAIVDVSVIDPGVDFKFTNPPHSNRRSPQLPTIFNLDGL